MDYCCSDGSLRDKIIYDPNKTPDLSQRPPQNCPKCGTRLMVIIVKDVIFYERNLRKICLHIVLKMEIFKIFKILLSHPMTLPTLLMLFKSHSKGARYGYNCPPKVPIIPNPEPCNNQTVEELPQTVPSFDTTCYSEDEKSFTYDSKSNLVDDSPNIFNPPPQPLTYSYEFYGNDAYYGHDCPLQIHITYAESGLIESLVHLDSSFIFSSSKNDSLLDEFADELTLLKSIPPGINETDCDPEEEIHLYERLLYDNSSPHLPEEVIFENSNTAIESFSPSPIHVEDSDSFMEEIDLSFTLDDSMPPSIEEDDYDSERDILILEELLSNDSLSLPENESIYFDIPSSSCPPAKPPDGNSGILNVKVMGDISKHKPSIECPMMIYERNTPILDVPLLHFYPP
uniref:Reverse transcriptase domain-containing protein n=1 Tax=Tanacetum cinerariifolium TaxID=118510 RepID=A0A6L2MUB5_TANCI|nr:hypothetical protein [Tanacetum cinerariifolium]